MSRCAQKWEWTENGSLCVKKGEHCAGGPFLAQKGEKVTYLSGKRKWGIPLSFNAGKCWLNRWQSKPAIDGLRWTLCCSLELVCTNLDSIGVLAICQDIK